MTTRVLETRAVFKAPPHLLDPSRTLAVWFTDPPGMVVQFARSAPCTLPVAQWLAGPARESLLNRFPGNGPLVFVLDLTHMNGRDPQVRALILEAARPLASRAQRCVVVPPENASRVYLASVRAAASLARVFGLTVSVESSSEAVRSLSAASPNP
jgi:hypothetical protein